MSAHPIGSVLRSSWFAPTRVLFAGAIVALAAFLCLIWLAARIPSLGFGLDAPPDGPGVVVTRIDGDSPAFGQVRTGELLLAIEGRDGSAVPLDRAVITRVTYALPSYAAFNAFFERHARLYHLLRQDQVVLVFADGKRVTVTPLPTRSLGALTAHFWTMNVLASLAFLMGLGVLVFRPGDAVARWFFLACLGLVGTAATNTLILGREFTFDPAWAGTLWGVNLVSRLLSNFGLLMVFGLYPRRVLPTALSTAIGLVFVLSWIGATLQWFPRPGLSAPLVATLTVLVLVPVLAYLQWRASRSDPIDRATVKVLILSMAIPAAIITVFNQVPVMLGMQPPLESGTALSLINFLIYVGCAIGIARYSLFKLDRWWFETLMWAIGGALVILFDAVLLWFNASLGLALGTALALAGWVYFPLRQWLWRRISPEARHTIESHLPQLIQTLFSARSTDELDDNWRALLQRVYAPLRVSLGASVAAPLILENGLRLSVPSLDAKSSVELHHADKGQRLFSPSDVRLAASLLALTRQAAQARRAIDQQAADRDARLREKERLVQDLHDGLGGMATNIGLLASMARKDQDLPAIQGKLSTISDLADESLGEIRNFMYSLEDSDAEWPAVVADLRAYGRKLLEPHGVAFEMTTQVDDAVAPPDSLVRLNLARVYKEALTNVVKHARASRVRTTLHADGNELRLTIEDDGVGFPDHAPIEAGTVKSRGIGNLHRRAEQMGGRLELTSGAGTTVRLTLPLPAKCPP
jgi:signal transduction histidine kinase